MYGAESRDVRFELNREYRWLSDSVCCEMSEPDVGSGKKIQLTHRQPSVVVVALINWDPLTTIRHTPLIDIDDDIKTASIGSPSTHSLIACDAQWRVRFNLHANCTHFAFESWNKTIQFNSSTDQSDQLTFEIQRSRGREALLERCGLVFITNRWHIRLWWEMRIYGNWQHAIDVRVLSHLMRIRKTELPDSTVKGPISQT